MKEYGCNGSFPPLTGKLGGWYVSKPTPENYKTSGGVSAYGVVLHVTAEKFQNLFAMRCSDVTKNLFEKKKSGKKFCLFGYVQRGWRNEL
jgi:hypothetical protein